MVYRLLIALLLALAAVLIFPVDVQAGACADSSSGGLLVLPSQEGVALWPGGAMIQQMFVICGDELKDIAKCEPELKGIKCITYVDYIIPGPPAPPEKILEFYAGTLIEPDWRPVLLVGGQHPKGVYQGPKTIISVAARPRGASVIGICGKIGACSLPAVERVVRAVLARRANVPAEILDQVNAAIELQMTGKATEAVALMRCVVASCPSASAAHYYLGVFLSDQGKLDEAGQQFRQAISLAPLNTAYRVRYAQFLCARGDIANAQYELNQVAAINPQAAKLNLLAN